MALKPHDIFGGELLGTEACARFELFEEFIKPTCRARFHIPMRHLPASAQTASQRKRFEMFGVPGSIVAIQRGLFTAHLRSSEMKLRMQNTEEKARKANGTSLINDDVDMKACMGTLQVSHSFDFK